VTQIDPKVVVDFDHSSEHAVDPFASFDALASGTRSRAAVQPEGERSIPRLTASDRRGRRSNSSRRSLY
jgi:hypothetical protein